MAARDRFRLTQTRPDPHDRKFYFLSGSPRVTPGFVRIQIKQFILNRVFSSISCGTIVNVYTQS